MWEAGNRRDATLEELKDTFGRPTWIDITDPTIEDLEKISQTLGISGNMLVAKLGSNYPHIDSYPEYTKIFAWRLSPITAIRGLSFRKNPVVILTNTVSAITISNSRTHLSDRVTGHLGKNDLPGLSITARVVYLTLIHLLEGYERSAEHFERLAESMEEVIPPWPRDFYTESFNIRKEAGRLLRLLNHFRVLTESLARGRVDLALSNDEKRAIDAIYDRTVGASETVEMSLQTVRDLIELHLDTVSHDMNRAMRLMAAITCIVAIPSVIGALLGMNLIDVPWPWKLWEVALVGTLAALLPAAYFYNKGWLGGK